MLYHPLSCNVLSYALWERKRIILVVAFSTLLAHTAACLYGLCLFLSSARFPDVCNQSPQLLAHTGMELFVWIAI
jgi:hypothetical protein